MFKRQAREWKAHARYMVDTPFSEVKNNVRRVQSSPDCYLHSLKLCEAPFAPSVASLALEKGVGEDVIKDACATMYMAGTDTVSTFLPIARFPDNSRPSVPS